MSYLGQKRVRRRFFFWFEAVNQLHPMVATRFQNSLFGGLKNEPKSTVKSQNYVPLLSGHRWQPHSIARPTFLFILDRTGPGPSPLVSKACLKGCLMKLILGLIVPKSPCAGPFSGTPPLAKAGMLPFFLPKIVRLCWNMLQVCMCQVSDLYFFNGLQKLVWKVPMKASNK